MLAPYRSILALPGALAFCGAGLLARMPASMMGLSLLLLLSAERGSYTLAGQVTAAYVFLAAVVSPFQARLVERLVPASRLSEGIAWTTSFLLGGYALGGALTAVVIDNFHAGFLVPPAVAMATACCAFLIPRTPSASLQPTR
ncbi:hypothetical protein ABZ470_10835 [Streptosporangium sp. NPDC020072]|uniref:hypothetical protein n=1 Tax=Streptosporangium sp. NPDC020072 TaxID=3154788 RepID=UPI003420478D